MNIFLDDERNPSDVTWVALPDVEWYIARNMKDFIHLVDLHGLPEHISFDHDLQDFNEDGSEKTGYDCLKWIVSHCQDCDMMPPTCFFHTMNPCGKKNMQSYYDNFVEHCNK